MSIYYLHEDVAFPKILRRRLSKWIKEVILLEGKITGDISFVFCSDNYLLEVNKRYLEHDYFTDIITFDYVVDNVISGDILISIERVRENADTFGVSFNFELDRVIIHGVLHLLGYKDSTSEERYEMRNREDYYLKLLNNY